MGETGLSGELFRTKCSGPGKKVREFDLFVPVGATFAKTNWLETGFNLWAKLVPKDIDFFVPRLSANMEFFTKKAPSSSDLAGMQMKVLVMLRAPKLKDNLLREGEGPLLDEPMAMVWTGHSERATLTSLAAAVGIPKHERDYLGRWSPCRL